MHRCMESTIPLRYDKLKLDLHYIRNYSLWMDLILIVLTPKEFYL